MIVAYTGVPGGGKSVHAAQDISDGLRFKDQLVISNVPINLDYFSGRKKKKSPFLYIPNNELDPNEIIKLAKTYYQYRKFSESGVLLVLDEAQLIFNSRSWYEKSRKDWVYLMTNSRHFGIKVIIITQMLEMLDKQIRGCIEIEYIHRNMANFGWLGKIISVLVGGKLFVVVGRYLGLRQQISSQYVFGRRHLYKLYDSYATM